LAFVAKQPCPVEGIKQVLGSKPSSEAVYLPSAFGDCHQFLLAMMG